MLLHLLFADVDTVEGGPRQPYAIVQILRAFVVFRCPSLVVL